MIRIVISGINGRMGKRIGFLASKDRDFEISSALEAQGNPAVGKDIGELLSIDHINKKVYSDMAKLDGCYDVLVEFTNPAATMEHLDIAVKDEKAVVIGTTNFSEEEHVKIKMASGKIPIVFSPNMSLGANLLFRITGDIARVLGRDYGVEIIEAHHDQKKDAPSGTAKKLAESVSGPGGKPVPIHSIRIGDIVGDHTVMFAGKSERIELTHRVHSRDAFARGTLDAAKFLIGKKPGLYTMQDVISSLCIL